MTDKGFTEIWNNAIGIFFERGVPMTTSLEVARVFRRSHSSIAASIRHLTATEGFIRTNYTPQTYRVRNANNRISTNTYYKITMAGFIVLTAGFNKSPFIKNNISLTNTAFEYAREVGPENYPCADVLPKELIETTSVCGRCKKTLPLEAFASCSSRTPPVQSRCRECQANDDKERRAQRVPDDIAPQGKVMIFPDEDLTELIFCIRTLAIIIERAEARNASA